MAGWRETLYRHSPWVVKEWLVAAEALRRNTYRRPGDHERAKRENSLEQYRTLSVAEIQAIQLQKLQALFRHAREHSPFYRDRLPERMESLEALRNIPILTKDEVRRNTGAILADDYDIRKLWKGHTSGSTGTPLVYYRDRRGVQTNTAILDNFYELYGCRYGERRVRFGGAQVVPADVKKPPYWVYVRPYNQLLMSSYHLSEETLPLYVQKFNEFRPKYIVGYGHTIYTVAQHIRQYGGLEVPITCVFTDSEGVPEEHQRVIEEAFGCPCRADYGLSEMGLIAAQLHDHVYHVFELAYIMEVVDAAGNPVPDGESGRIIVTDLKQDAMPYIRYDTGDIGAVTRSCDCAYNSLVLDRIEGRADDVVVTPAGRRVTRLSYVTKPGRGILESQIAQTARDRVVIRVVPAQDFDPTSMEDVLRVARDVLGSEMRVDWELVEFIPRTQSAKFKHVVREYQE